MAAIVLPWSILYKTRYTRLARRWENLVRFRAIVRSGQATLLDAARYRAASLARALAQDAPGGPLSLVDAVLCNVIENVDVPISAMLTFNERDSLAVSRGDNSWLFAAWESSDASHLGWAFNWFTVHGAVPAACPAPL